jgi:RNA polymerase sigma-70 factor, ECF subfamily
LRHFSPLPSHGGNAGATQAGDFIPLDEQDVSTWDHRLIERGELLLRRAYAFKKLGRFQLEASIQSVHANRARTGVTDWPALALLYEGLVRLAPNVGATVGRAAAVGYAQGPQGGLACLDLIAAEVFETYQPAVVTRAFLLARAGRDQEAISAYARAMTLTKNRSVRNHLGKIRETIRAAMSGH